MASEKFLTMTMSSNEFHSLENWPLAPMGSIDQMMEPEPSSEISSRSTPEFGETDEGTAHEENASIGFFDMPAEIRLQIYETILADHPFLPRTLRGGDPGLYPPPYFTEPVVRTEAKNADDDEDENDWTLVEFEELGLGSAASERPKRREKTEMSKAEKNSTTSSTRTLISPHRRQGYMPHSFLRTCRRIYREARCVPFRENEWVFTTLYSTGPSMAFVFMKGLRAWQWAAMTNVRLELRLVDIDGSDPRRKTQWEAVCEKWAFGLRELRLTIEQWPDNNGRYKRSTLESLCPEPGNGNGDCTSGLRWIDAGLKKLAALQRLEVELRTPALDDNQKFDWCERLKGFLSRGLPGQEEDIKFLCVKQKPKVSWRVCRR
ncbi:hypothetical protein V8F20_008022 [Naviculisporaceae sp. PSN 640]